jgi:hypothetical protein
VRKSLIIGGSSLLLFGVAGCGGGQDNAVGVVANQPAVAAPKLASVGPVTDPTHKVAVDAYATTVCTGLAQFGVDFHAAKAHRVQAMSGSATATRSALLGYYDALDGAFDRMLATTQRAGIPNLSDGREVASGVISTLDQARQAADKYRPKARGVGGSDPKDVRTAAEKIADNSDREVATVMHRLSRYDGDPQFRNAFTRAVTCQHG